MRFRQRRRVINFDNQQQFAARCETTMHFVQRRLDILDMIQGVEAGDDIELPIAKRHVFRTC